MKEIQTKSVKVEDGLCLTCIIPGKNHWNGKAYERSLFWYYVPMRGTWNDWVDLSQAIISAEKLRKKSASLE
jgi:hypothetical protein